MSATLYRKYRPGRWADVAGQQHIKVTLSFEVATGRIAHAYLFSGPRGTGKTTIARIFAKALNCAGEKGRGRDAGEPCGECVSCARIADGKALDIIEIDAASNRGIDNVRENIIENARFAPAGLPYKVFIIDEVHMLTTEAFNALLKTLEEPPAHAVFVLATTELHKVPPTIVSRCQRFDFRKIPYADLVERLRMLCDAEKCKVDPKVLDEIARHADGCLRDAEGLLGKVLTVGDGKRVSYDEALVVLPRSDFESVAAFVEALLRSDARGALMTIGQSVDNGLDMDEFAGESIELLRKVLLAKMSGGADAVAFDMDESRRKRLSEWAEGAELPQLVRAIEILMAKRLQMKNAHPLQLPLELAAVELCERIEAARPVAQRPPVRAAQGAGPETTQGTGGERSNVVPAPNHVIPANAGTQGSVSDAGHEAPVIARSEATKRVPDSRSDAIPPESGQSRSENAQPPSSPSAVPANVGTLNPVSADPSTPIRTIDELKALWRAFVERVGQANASLPFILGGAEPVEVAGARIKVGFSYAFHRDRFNDERCLAVAERAMEELLEAAVRLEGVLLDKKPGFVHTDEASRGPAAAPGATPTRVGEDLAAAFGGRVVEG